MIVIIHNWINTFMEGFSCSWVNFSHNLNIIMLSVDIGEVKWCFKGLALCFFFVNLYFQKLFSP